MNSPHKHKRASPVKDASNTNSIRTPSRLLSPSISRSEDDAVDPTPSKKQKICDVSNSFITSSPQRPAVSKVTPRKPTSRSLTADFDAQSSKECVEISSSITYKELKYEFSETSVADFSSLSSTSNDSQSHSKSVSISTSSTSSTSTSSLVRTVFSPLWKKCNAFFGSSKDSIESEANKENIHQTNGAIPTIIIEDIKTIDQTEVVTKLVSDEILSDSITNSPDTSERVEEYFTASEDEQEPDIDAQQEDEDEEEAGDFDPYLFIANLPHLKTIQSKRPAALPPKPALDDRLTLVLDLDETLVHCSTEPLADFEIKFPVVFNEIEYQVFVKKRPHFLSFLEAVSQKFEIVVFTASQEVYARNLLKLLDPESKYIHHQLYRDSCINVEGNFLKDLTILGRDLSKVIIVDNSPQTFGFQLDNGIPIESWFDDAEDQELLRLIPFLEEIHQATDVRPHLTSKYQLRQKVNLLKSKLKRF